MAFHNLSFFFFFIIAIPIIAPVSGDEAVDFTLCSKPFDCRSKTDLSYPFWATNHRPLECGHPGFELIGCGDRNQHPVLRRTESQLQLRLIAVNQSSKFLTVAVSDLWNTTCPPIYGTEALNSSLLEFAPDAAALQNLTLFYGCPLRFLRIPQTRLSCSIAGDSFREMVSFYANATSVRDEGLGATLQSCRGRLEFPIPADVADEIWGSEGETELRRVLDAGFNVSYSYGEYEASCEQCGGSGGLCGTAAGSPNFLCHCNAGIQPLITCPVSVQNGKIFNRWRRLLLGILLLLAVFTILPVIVQFYIPSCRWKKPKELNKWSYNNPGAKSSRLPAQFGGSRERPSLQAFSFSDIKAATNNFSGKNLLGSGGFGPVYKGVLPGGELMAVKRLSKSSTQGLVEFTNEVSLTARLQHVNLVRVVGFCTENEEKMLVYEFMPKGSLDPYIFDPVKKLSLDWSARVKIIEGVTQGLLYLQEYSNFTIIHRDLKGSNILLDDGMNAKISDFGMAKLFSKNLREANTNRIVGTYGYVPPEYVKNGIYSMKYDVYSFGVLLLQIISSKRSQRYYGPNEDMHLLDHAYDSWRRGEGMEFCDPALDDSSSQCKLMTCLQIALLCVQEDPNDRPTMLKVSSILKNGALGMASPKKPAFSVRKETTPAKISTFRQEIFSYNDADISQVEPR